jgi:hypothetical protein
MQQDHQEHNHREWGKDICIISYTDFNFMPGVYALFNSAIANGFKGEFRILTNDEAVVKNTPKHTQLSVLQFDRFDGTYSSSIHRLNALPLLSDGNYLFLDADIVFERPCGHLFAPLKEGIIVSTEPEAKYDNYDVRVYNQCEQLGISINDLRPYDYINCGLLGFSLPRDREVVNSWAELSYQYLGGMMKTCHDPYATFHFQQDILNIILRQPDRKLYSIPSRVLELANFSTIFHDRPFPYTLQGDLRPADQVKFIIHGASLRRPWRKPKITGSLKQKIVNALEPYGVGAWYRGTTPYERAWAYYACSEDLPIPLSAWAEQHNFTAYKNWLWRKAHGLS